MKYLITLLFCCLYLLPCKAQYFDTVTLHYNIGESLLSNKNKSSLDSLVQNCSTRKILIYGHADYLGTEDPNQLLSERRAKDVLHYLTTKGFNEKQIMQCTGSGQVKGNGSKEGDPESRRTDIFIIKERPTASATTGQAILPVKAKKQVEEIASIKYDDIKVGDTINLQNIQFITGEVTITPASMPEVDKLYRIMLNHPKLKIRLEGHVCCCIYPDGYFPDTPHWILSSERAKRIYKILIHKGIPAERMSYTGFGRTHPILDKEETEERGQVNRRVEIRILEK